MPFDVRTDFVKVTSDTVLVPVTIQMRNRDITFVNKDGMQRGTVNIFGRRTTLTGKIVQTFEDTVQVDVPAELLPRTAENASVYWKALPLRPGRYKLNIAVKDVNGDRKGVGVASVVVPEFTDEKLATSTLIVADQMEAVPTKAIGTGSFVIGTMKVRPRVAPADGKPAIFKRDKDQKLNFWMQVYNLGVDELDRLTHRFGQAMLADVHRRAQMMRFGAKRGAVLRGKWHSENYCSGAFSRLLRDTPPSASNGLIGSPFQYLPSSGQRIT